MNQYTKAISIRLSDTNKWPRFIEPYYLEKLQNIAIEATNKNTVEGQLAAILIIHQLTEELVKLLIENAYFYMQLKLYPLEFNKPKSKKIVMFGGLLTELESTISFQNKEIIIEKADQLNKIRIAIVHKLTKASTLSSLKKKTTEAWELYNSFSMSALHAHMLFQSHFKVIYQNSDWV